MNKTARRFNRLKSELRQGTSLKDAVYSGMGQELRQLGLKPLESLTDLSAVKRKLFPRPYERGKESKRIRAWSKVDEAIKKPLIRDVFGEHGERHLLMVIAPEMVPFTRDIRAFLSKHGVQVFHSKLFSYTPSNLARIYGAEMATRPSFSINSSILLSGLSRVMLLTPPNIDHLIKTSPFLARLQKEDPNRFKEVQRDLKNSPPAKAFAFILKGAVLEPREGSIRDEIVKRKHTELGFESRDDRISVIDPTTFLRRTNEDLIRRMAGIHTPEPDEIVKNAATYFSLPELIRLRSKLRKYNRT